MPFMELMGKIGLDGSAFSAGVAQVEKGVTKMSATFNNAVKGALKNRLVQAFGAAALVAQVKSVIDFGSKINDLSQRVGVSAEALQYWNFAATQSGATAEDVTGFFEKMAESRSKAFGGESGSIKAFEELGVSIDDLKNKRIEDVAYAIGKLFETGDPQKLIGPLREIGGRGAGGLISMFKDGLDDSADSAKNLGIILSDGVVGKLDEMGDKLDIFAAKMRGPVATGTIFITKLFSDLVDIVAAYSAMAGGFAGGQGGISGRLASGRKAFFDEVDSQTKRDEDIAQSIQKKKASRNYQPPTDAEITTPKEKKEKEKLETPNFITDSLAKIGGFTLGQDASILNVAKKQLATLEKIEDNTRIPAGDGL